MKPIVPLSLVLFMAHAAAAASTDPAQAGPPADEQQEARAMRTRMDERPRIRVGKSTGDLRGDDQRALQAAVDYVAALGGGTVEIGEGEFLMRDSLHLRPQVMVRGTGGRTVLKKGAGVVSRLAMDGDYGEEQVTVQDAGGFQVGDGIAVWDSRSGGFHTTVARIIGKKGSTLALDKPLNADCMVANQASAATVFPVVSGYALEGVVLEDLIIEGNKAENVHLNGCRGAGIFLYRGFGTVIRNCTVRNYNGDGISFQQSNDVQVLGCTSEDNASLGIHPGSGSQRPLVRECQARRNGEDGLFLCWRVRHGRFEANILEENGRFGISIGHKDTDNTLLKNIVRFNHQDGVFFREEAAAMAGHRNRIEESIIENNGVQGSAAGIRVRGETSGLLFKNNIIRDTRPAADQTQKVGIRIEEKAGQVALEGNRIEAATTVEDKRK